VRNVPRGFTETFKDTIMVFPERAAAPSFAELLVDESPDALIALAVDGRIRLWNRGASVMFGYTAEQAVGRLIDELTVPEDRIVEARTAFEQAVREGSSLIGTIRRRKDGGLLQVDVSMRRVDVPGGESFIALNEKDVTPLRREELAASEVRFRNLVESAPDAMVIANREGTILIVNAQTERLFGYARAELVGQKLELLMPERVRVRHSAHRVRFFENPHERPIGPGSEFPCLRKDGREFPAEISLSPLHLDDEVLVSSAIRDITERKKRDATFRALLESAPDAMVIVGPDGGIRLVNAQTEKLFGYSRQDLVGQSVEVLVPPRLRHSHQQYREHYFAAPRTRAMGAGLELLGLRQDGSEVPIEISLSPIQTDEGILVSSAIRDISERRHFEKRMRDASRLKSEFLANMSHELRTPLNAIIGFAELMFRGKVGPVSAEHQEYLGDILSSSKHLLQLINDVLDLAKVESGKMEFRPESVDLATLSNEVRDVLRGLAASKRLQVQTFIDPEVAIVTVDPARVKQVLYNYLSNAIKFTPEGGRISIHIAPEGATLFRIDVTDTGVGIPAEDLARLFREFQQLDATTTKTHQGTGLGLALTKRLAEAQGGRVSVQSTPGTGSTFSVVLPRVMTVSAEDEVRPIRLEDGNLKVLVVDDDPSALKIADAALRELGYQAIGTTSAEEGLRIFEAEPPACIIVDLLMPGVDGFEFVARLRTLESGHRVPVVVWTIKDVDADERRRLQVAIISKRRGAWGTFTEQLRRLLPPVVPRSRIVHGG
jgi:protein-histidine pros-kinase